MKGHIVYFDVLRVIAILAVITLHVATAHFYNTDVLSFTWGVSNMWDGLVRWGVPVFVMISGALFLDPTREIDFHKLYSKNIFHIVCALLFWSFCYAGVGFVTGPSQGNVEKLLEHIVIGHFHLWFLYMLLGLYIIVPLLRPICRDIKLVRYFLLLSLFFSFLIPSIVRILTGLDLAFPDSIYSRSLRGVNKLFEQTYFHFTLGYAAYFVLGYYIHRLQLSANQRKVLYLLGILGWECSILFTQFVSRTTHQLFDFYTGWDVMLPVLFETLAVFVFVKYHIHMLPAKLISVFNYLSKCVLGIYLVHVGVQSCLDVCFNLSSTSFNPLFSIPLITFLVFILSWAFVEIIRRIPLLNKYII